MFYMQGEGVLLDFYPRPPRGGRLVVQQRAVALKAFLSTPSARRATAKFDDNDGNFEISIHALREEGDRVRFLWSSQRHNFYPRPPRGGRLRHHRSCHLRQYFYPRPPRGGRRRFITCSTSAKLFLSTPSARRATGTFHGASRNTPYFYPRPPRGGRPLTFPR